MPRKIKKLIKEYKNLGFELKSTKGSHRKFEHPSGLIVIIAGKDNDDCKEYNEKDLKNVKKKLGE